MYYKIWGEYGPVEVDSYRATVYGTTPEHALQRFSKFMELNHMELWLRMGNHNCFIHPNPTPQPIKSWSNIVVQ